jgi:3-oxoacyl-[acyl-carrier protein] reductase
LQKIGGPLKLCNYTASKAGILGYSKSVAQEMASYNIRCNVVMPGAIDTPMARDNPREGIK